MRHRSRNDIICAMLRAANRGATKTHIMYRAYLSYPQLREYLGLLMARDLLFYDEMGRSYELTYKGLLLLHLLENIESLIEPPPESDGKGPKSRTRQRRERGPVRTSGRQNAFGAF